MKKHYDALIIGHISKDTNIDLERTLDTTGGAVVYSTAAAVLDCQVGVVTKTALEDKDTLLKHLHVPADDIHYIPSAASTAIRNEYFSVDRERRNCYSISIADPFLLSDLPAVKADVYHLASLIYGDFSESMAETLSSLGRVALDVQGFVRHAVGGEMVYRDWALKRTVIPHVYYLKADAAEAELLTGSKDIFEAAEIFRNWGATEVMITHNEQVVVQSDEGVFASPIRSRNFSGRTGRGDTCFAAYYSHRRLHDTQSSTLYAAALVSLKMETPGPFMGSSSEVAAYISRFY